MKTTLIIALALILFIVLLAMELKKQSDIINLQRLEIDDLMRELRKYRNRD